MSTADTHAPTLADIKKAETIIRPFTIETPILKTKVQAQGKELDTIFKLENTQVTGSFKVRGNGYKFSRLLKKASVKGVIAMSAGNHAQGVAYHAQKHNLPAIIVMPVETPLNKVEATRRWGAEVVLSGHTLNESKSTTVELSKKNDYELIHPYDDPDIITGQGTCALELYRQAPECTAVLMPIGGGGFGAGVSIALKALNPKIKIYGVQTTAFPSMKHHLDGKKLVFSDSASTLAEGIAVKMPGQLTDEILRKNLEDIFLVDESSIENAIYDLATLYKQVVEGAAATTYAALTQNAHIFAKETTGLILTGGNIDPRILSSILLRGMIQHNKLMRLIVPTKDTPGQLAQMAAIIAKHRANVIKVSHQRLFHAASAREMDMEFIIEIRSYTHGQEVVQSLIDAGFQVKETPSF